VQGAKPPVVVCCRMPRCSLLVLLFVLASCGGKGASAGGERKSDLDADPLGLLPADPMVVASLDARAVFDSGAAGSQIASIAGRLVPLGESAGFQATRDVERVVLAEYATGGIDCAAVLTGHFDPAKIDAATTASGGAPIVRGVYGGRTTHTVAAVQYAVLTPKTLVAGTGDGLRRLLDRVQAGTMDRSMAPWMVSTLETKGAEIAVAADFETQPVASAAIGAVRLPWLDGMHVARIIGNFEPPGMNVAATLTYGDAVQSQTAADGMRSVEGLLKMLGPLLGGIRLQNLEVTTDAKDLRCKFGVDQDTLRTVLAFAPRFLPMTP
jgi:hypothetical protein